MSSIGVVTVGIVGVRVAGKPGDQPLTFVPAHRKNGKDNQAMLKFSGYVNHTQGDSDILEFVLWGKMAEIGAKVLSPGKEFGGTCRMKSFRKRVFYNDRSPVLDKDGSQIMSRNVSFELREPVFGTDSASQVENEISRNKRPKFWSVPGHADATAWEAARKTRMATVWTPGQTTFGFAKVLIPENAELTTQPDTTTATTTAAQQATQPPAAPTIEEITKAVVAAMANSTAGTAAKKEATATSMTDDNIPF